MKILLTGGAGFIGANLAKKLIEKGDEVLIVDNFNDYYSPQLKRDRVASLLKGLDFKLEEGDIRDADFLAKIFKEGEFDQVVHLAAMVGVRYSVENPAVYEEVNVRGTLNLLNLAQKHGIKKFLLASTSSVYGNNAKLPFSETDPTQQPASPYAATKKSAELMGRVFSHLYQLPVVCLRFFTVYGPWGRPDMAPFKFVKKVLNNESIEVYNQGEMRRSFTYIDDVIAGTLLALNASIEDLKAAQGGGTELAGVQSETGAKNFDEEKAPYALVNIGHDEPTDLMDFISLIEKHTGKTAQKKMLPMQPGDIQATAADISKLKKLGWQPQVGAEEGVKNLVEWVREYEKK